MARKPDIPCADCGELMWRGSGVLPEGQATCLPCRRSRRPTAPSVEQWKCQGCGTLCERKPTKGQRPKWCKDCRGGTRVKAISCEHCGTMCMTWTKGRFCSRDCASAAQVKPKVEKPRFDPRGPLRRGYEDGDPDLFFAALVSKADTTGECWVWPSLRDGYPFVRMNSRDVALHRLVLEVKHGAPLGSQAAHHVCANSACVNPEHLQPVTHRENVAEMLARRSYLSRIADLEEALRNSEPDHPLLAVISVA